MKIAQYLNELLMQRESVIVPGFGEFKSVTHPPAKSSDSKTIMPPEREVSFNASVKVNDYVLAKYVSEKEGISISKGNDMIKDFVGEIHAQLEDNKTIRIPGIGLLISDGKGGVEFKQEAGDQTDQHAYGLSAAVVSPQKTSQIPSNKTNIKEEKKSSKPERKKRRGWLWLLIILLVIAVAVVWCYFNGDTVNNYWNKATDYFSKNMTSLVDRDTTNTEGAMNDSLPIADTLAFYTDTLSQEAAPEELPGEPAEEAEATTAQKGISGNYYVVTGCFSSIDNAERMVQELKKKGYNGALIVDKTTSGLHRVALGAYPSQQEADRAMIKSQSDMELRSAWVLKL
jgi:nucleoid DNA-binding protein